MRSAIVVRGVVRRLDVWAVRRILDLLLGNLLDLRWSPAFRHARSIAQRIVVGAGPVWLRCHVMPPDLAEAIRVPPRLQCGRVETTPSSPATSGLLQVYCGHPEEHT